MKKMIWTVMAVLSMTITTFAKDENANANNAMSAFDMSVKMNKLSQALNLTTDQTESVADVHHTFCGEMMVAAQANDDDRKELMMKAVNKDLKYMHYILNKDQYRKYLLILNATLNNRGLNFIK
ncbi:MAG: hypothetical protein SOZ58_10775 [Prevotella sp.]|nr:hypothetical protein [Prevotella sp.]